MRQLLRCISASCLVTGFSLLVGCKTDVTAREPFAAYTNHPVALERDAYLSPRNGVIYGHEKLLHAGPKAEAEDVLLPMGTPVTVRSVTAYTSGIPMIAAHGSVVKSSGEPPTEFEFIWASGDGKKFQLSRAPWEPAAIPESREFLVTPAAAPEKK